MADIVYPRERTALLFVDPYNDFLSEGGKIYPRVKEVADGNGLLDNLRRVSGAARAAGIQVLIVPHRRWEPGDYEDWDHPNPTQRAIMHRPAAGRHRRQGALGPERLRQHRPGFPAEAEGDHPCDPGRAPGQHLHRIHRPLRHGARLPRDPGARRDGRLLPRHDARRA
ncbi:MAG: isochorismatase family protein [Inquilinus limosus]|uniref:Isochorismatase family protein n=1 Tax=Inquilinus limosus TaxID=171674 RepID=A0A952FVB4_9PROT|nr:isochorismatase family protein [Inquilinus limosus]